MLYLTSTGEEKSFLILKQAVDISNPSIFEKGVAYSLNEETNLPYFFDVINISKISNQNLIDHIDRVGKNILNL